MEHPEHDENLPPEQRVARQRTDEEEVALWFTRTAEEQQEADR